MANAYTPGLKVLESAPISKTRRLPIPGEVLVEVGQRITPETIVARTKIPGNPQTVNVATLLGLEPEDIEHFLLVKVGDTVERNQVLALYKAFFGLFKRSADAPVAGVVEHISEVTGQITLREPPIPVEVDAYIDGVVTEIFPGEGVTIETNGAFIQGIFGVGGEKQGEICVAVKGPDDVLEASHIDESHKGKILIGGSLVTTEALHKADSIGVAGIVVGGVIDSDLVDFLGYDIGVAITGHEEVNTTLIITEGFGKMRMAEKTWKLLNQLAGYVASLNGATQIRAGVMRPEIIVPGFASGQAQSEEVIDDGMMAGTSLRIIREPYFGLIAEVVDLPPDLHQIETEARVRILRAKLEDGTIVTVPRANVEIIEG